MPTPDPFIESEVYKRAVDIAQELDYTEVWHLIKRLQQMLYDKSYLPNKGETDKVSPE